MDGRANGTLSLLLLVVLLAIAPSAHATVTLISNSGGNDGLGSESCQGGVKPGDNLETSLIVLLEAPFPPIHINGGFLDTGCPDVKDSLEGAVPGDKAYDDYVSFYKSQVSEYFNPYASYYLERGYCPGCVLNCVQDTSLKITRQEDGGIFIVGAYFYHDLDDSVPDLNNIGFNWRAWQDNYHDCELAVFDLMVFDVNHLTGKVDFSGGPTKVNSHDVFLHDFRYLDNRAGDSGWHTTTDDTYDFSTLPEGVYFLTMMVRMQGDDTYSRDENAQVNIYEHWTLNADTVNRISEFPVYNRFLNQDDFLLVYDGDENQKFCEYAGGKYYDSERMTLPDKSYHCCGDDENEIGILSYTDDSGNTHYCTTGGWKTGEEERYCASNVEGAGPNVYQSFSTAVPWYSIGEITDGSDGCCGDDANFACRPSDVSSCSSITNQQDCDTVDQCSWKVTSADPQAYCQEHEVYAGDIPDGCDEQGHNAGCVAVADSYWSDEMGYVPSYSCEPSPSMQVIVSEECEGELETTPCSLYITQAACPDVTCTWTPITDGTDDYGHIEEDYLCLNDYDGNQEPQHIAIQDGQWQWWDAYEQEYTIHPDGEVDFISNGEKWFSCDVIGGAESSEDIVLSNYELLPPTTLTGIFYGDDSCHPGITDYALINPDPSDRTQQKWFNYILASECDMPVWNTDDPRMAYDTYVDSLGADLTDEEKKELKDSFIGCCEYEGGIPNDFEPTSGFEASSAGAGLSYVTNDYYTFFKPSLFGRECSSLVCKQDQENLPGGSDGDGGGGSGFADEDDARGPTSGTASFEERTCQELSSAITHTEVCEEEEHCVFFSGDGREVSTSGGTERCCLNGHCKLPEEETCEALGGMVTTGTGLTCLRGDVPEGQPYEVQALGMTEADCCLGKLDYDVGNAVIFEPRPNEAIMCYQDIYGESAFGECCSNENCQNAFLWDGDYLGEDNGKTFTPGNHLYTIESFDLLEQSFLRELTGENTIAVSGSGDHSISLHFTIPSRASQRFDSISFEMKYDDPAGLLRPESIDFYSSTTNVGSFALKDIAIINTLPSGIWNKFTIPIENQGLFYRYDITGANIVFARTSTPGSGDVTVYTDNFVFHEEDEEQEWFCAGDHRTWVRGLEPPNPEEASAEEVVPYAHACEEQFTTTWTGTYCCGADTKSTSYDQAEFYIDNVAACWAGRAVGDDMPVSRAFHSTAHWPHILFYDNAFYSCNEDESFTSIDDEKFSTNPAENPDYLIRKASSFAIVGSWYCDPGSSWEPAEGLPASKFLVSKLYDLANKKNFSLHCDEYDTGAFMSTSLNWHGIGVTGDGETPATLTPPVATCVLKTADDEETNVTIGLALPGGEEPNTYLNHYAEAFKDSLYPAKDFSDVTIPDCTVDQDDNPILDLISEGAFFTECKGSGEEGFRAYYNKPLNLLLISQDSKASGGFFGNMWDAITGFFKSLFSTDEEDDLPAITGDVTIADFTHFYFARAGDDEVKGLMNLQEIGQYAGDFYGRVDYLNFSASVLPLAESYDELDAVQDLSLCQSGNTQSIFFQVNSNDLDEFDWRYLTSNLRLKDTLNDATYAGTLNCGTLHNGVLDPGEECDDDWEAGEYYTIIVPESHNSSHYCDDNQGRLKGCVNGKLSDSFCDAYFVLYVTDDAFSGSFSAGKPTPFVGADQHCKDAFYDAGANNKYGEPLSIMAVLSTKETSVRDRFSDYLSYDFTMANSGSYGTLEKLFPGADGEEPLALYNVITAIDGGEVEYWRVWTGSLGNGESAQYDCDGWSTGSTNFMGAYGNRMAVNKGDWLGAGYSSNPEMVYFETCSGPSVYLHLYCLALVTPPES
ncbi:hypothetical protein JXA12_02580 [Candidatus Woesearchaeota archaeon]|nr:hypothetical protein [Candidatus Woesearchaeota archaeon]